MLRLGLTSISYSFLFHFSLLLSASWMVLGSLSRSFCLILYITISCFIHLAAKPLTKHFFQIVFENLFLTKSSVSLSHSGTNSDDRHRRCGEIWNESNFSKSSQVVHCWSLHQCWSSCRYPPPTNCRPPWSLCPRKESSSKSISAKSIPSSFLLEI